MTRTDFEELIDERRRLIAAANELEYQLYLLPEAGEHPHIAACQQAAGTMLGLLRQVLFRHDQEVLPLVEAALGGDACP